MMDDTMKSGFQFLISDNQIVGNNLKPDLQRHRELDRKISTLWK